MWCFGGKYPRPFKHSSFLWIPLLIFLMGREGKDVVDGVIAGVVFDKLVSLLLLCS